MYFDGHEWKDVIEDREKYLNILAELDKITICKSNPNPLLVNGQKPLIRVVHDEITFYANCDQSYFWADAHTSVIKQKSLGQSIMISDFIEEVDGFLTFQGHSARVSLEIQKDGYFDNDKFMRQVERTVDIFESKYPFARALFLFDNAPSHRKMADNQLNADLMNVYPGGKQPLMRDTKWAGEIQTMVLPDGQAKGMKLVLEERGVDTTGMKTNEMRDILKGFDDFKASKTILEEYIEMRGHLCLYIPKYHCELSPIERVWCFAKKHTRAYADGRITKLRKIVPEGLSLCSTPTIQKYFATCRDYEQAYKNGSTGKDVDLQVKVYKSHRRVFDSTCT